MSFLSPAFLAAAAVAALPIVLHLLRRHPERRIRFAPVHLLRTAPVEQSQRRRLRDLLLLALRVAAVVLIAIAFARPFLPRVSAGGISAVTVVAVDTSFSLSAPGAFDRARALAREAVRHAPSGQAVALERFADDAVMEVEATRDRQQVIAAIDQLQPGYGATSYANAIARAAGAIGRRAGTIVLVTDLQSGGWQSDAPRAAIPAGVTVQVADVGAPDGNLAVVDLRRQPGGVVATISNAGGHSANGQARLTVNGRAAGAQAFSIPARQSADVAFEADLPDAGAAQVALDDRTGYAADNTRFLALDPPAPATVLAITQSTAGTQDGFYVEQALKAGESGVAGASLVRFAPRVVKTSALSNMSAADLARVRAIVLLSTLGLDRKGREALTAFVRGGGGLLVAAGPTVDADVLRNLLDNGPAFDVKMPHADGPALSLVASDTRHPILAAFGPAVGSLGAARFQRVAQVSVSTGAEVVAQFSNGAPALVEYPATGGRVLLFASDLDGRWNDLPLHPTFLPLIDEALGYLAGPAPREAAYLVGSQPTGLPPVPGVRTEAATDGAPPVHVAVNVDPRESDPSRMTPADFQGALVHLKDEGVSQARTAAAADEGQQALWWYALALALAALAAESLVAKRTV